MTAPKVAAEAMPMMYGSASGFKNTLCTTTPEVASSAPTKMPITRRGRRICSKMSCLVSSISPKVKNFTMSPSEMLAPPLLMATKASKTKAAIRKR